MAIRNAQSVNLPTTTLSVAITSTQYESPDNFISHGANFSNWSVDAGSSKTSSGVQLVQNGTAEYAAVVVSGLQPNTVYWCSMKLLDKSAGANGNFRVAGIGTTGAGYVSGNFGATGNLGDFDIPNPTGGFYSYFQLSTDGSPGPYKLVLRHATSPDAAWLRFSDFRVYSNPSRSSAKVAVLGDRAGTYTAAYGNAVNTALLDAASDTVNVIAVGDQADSTNSYASVNDALLTGLRARGGNIYPAMGNHDYDASRETEWMAYYDHVSGLNGGRRYYRKILGEVEYFITNTCGSGDNAGGPAPEDNNGGRQAASAAAFESSVMGQWLQTGLASSTSKWKVVVIHHPAHTSSATGPFTSCRMSFANWGADVVLQSHDHGVERIYKDGIYYYTCAMGGGNHHGWTTILPETKFRLDSNYTTAYQTTYGYLKISDSPTDLILEYFTTGHKMFDRARIRRAS